MKNSKTQTDTGVQINLSLPSLPAGCLLICRKRERVPDAVHLNLLPETAPENASLPTRHHDFNSTVLYVNLMALSVSPAYFLVLAKHPSAFCGISRISRFGNWVVTLDVTTAFSDPVFMFFFQISNRKSITKPLTDRRKALSEWTVRRSYFQSQARILYSSKS
jgi:hypothetical protein